MITVLSGTNRKGSLTKAFAEKYFEIISEQTSIEVQFIALEDIVHDWFSAEMYAEDQLSKGLIELQEKYILQAKSLVVFSPEYNGGFPGVLKLFIDACSVRKYPENFKNKKIGFVGIADGRAGNLRGMGQLAAIFNYLGAVTFPNQLPISSASSFLDKHGKITDTSILKTMIDHASDFVDFVVEH